jgi:hypothetical protein
MANRASVSSRASVSGYLRNNRTRAGRLGIWFRGTLFPFLQRSFVDGSLRANTAHEKCSFFRVSRRSLESTSGSGTASTL